MHNVARSNRLAGQRVEESWGSESVRGRKGIGQG